MLVLAGGPVFTGRGWVRGVAVRDGRVVAAGDERTARSWIGDGTRVVDLAGRTALPGFHDAHTHLIGGALSEEAPDLSGVRSSEELAEVVRAWIAAHPELPWVHGRGWDADLFPGGAWPRRADLDAVAPDRPVLLRRRDGHAAIANACALRRAGITRDTPDPPGGRIPKDAAGEPTGVLLEDPALELVTRHVPPVDRERTARAVARVLKRAVALGITSLQDDPSYDDALRPGELYAGLLERGELPLRVSIWRKLGRDLEELAAETRQLAARAPAERVRYGLLKGYLDGSLGSRTAHLFAPYCDHADETGVDLDEARLLFAHAAAAHRAGHQLGLHAIGDRAASDALDAFAAAEPDLDALRARRHRVEHAQLLRPEDIPRLARLGAVASVQPIHLASDIHIAAARLGPERCRTAYPWRALLDVGARLAFGTDYPIEPLDPLPGLVCALTRTTPREPGVPPFVPEQAVTLDEALRAYTLGAAEAAHLEADLGHLTPGAHADVAVLDRDLTALPPAELTGARCVLTVVGGAIVHDAQADPT